MTVAVECMDEVKEAVEVVARVVAVCYKMEEAEPVETLPVGVGVEGTSPECTAPWRRCQEAKCCSVVWDWKFEVGLKGCDS